MTVEMKQPSEPTTGPIVVALVEDDRGTREGLAALIDGTAGFRCRDTFRSVEQALEARPQSSPDVLLLDIHLPGMLGAEGIPQLRQKFPGAAVLMLTVYEEEDWVFESICNGACGYLLKRTPPARLLEAIREAHAGGSPMTPEIARKVVELFRRALPEPGPVERLTVGEARLVGLLAEGHSYQACGERLGVSINTVRSYVRQVYDKLHVHSRSAAVAKALRAGFLSS